MAPNRLGAGLLLLLGLAACGGQDDGANQTADAAALRAKHDSIVAARTPAGGSDSLKVHYAETRVGGTTDNGQLGDSAAADSSASAQETEIARETFAYGGGSRDPFESLFDEKQSGPELVDLQLVGVYQDLSNPSNSVAVLRDRSTGKGYKLRAGDPIGRMRVARVGSKDVVFTITEFGYDRQATLSLRKQEDVTP